MGRVSRSRKQRRRTCKNIRKKKRLLKKQEEIREADASDVIQQLETPTIIRLRELEMQRRQPRSYSSWSSRRWDPCLDRRYSRPGHHLDDVWNPNYDDDDDHSWPTNSRCGSFNYDYQYTKNVYFDNYGRNYGPNYSNFSNGTYHPTKYYSDFKPYKSWNTTRSGADKNRGRGRSSNITVNRTVTKQVEEEKEKNESLCKIDEKVEVKNAEQVSKIVCITVEKTSADDSIADKIQSLCEDNVSEVSMDLDNSQDNSPTINLSEVLNDKVGSDKLNSKNNLTATCDSFVLSSNQNLDNRKIDSESSPDSENQNSGNNSDNNMYSNIEHAASFFIESLYQSNHFKKSESEKRVEKEYTNPSNSQRNTNLDLVTKNNSFKPCLNMQLNYETNLNKQTSKTHLDKISLNNNHTDVHNQQTVSQAEQRQWNIVETTSTSENSIHYKPINIHLKRKPENDPEVNRKYPRLSNDKQNSESIKNGSANLYQGIPSKICQPRTSCTPVLTNDSISKLKESNALTTSPKLPSPSTNQPGKADFLTTAPASVSGTPCKPLERRKSSAQALSHAYKIKETKLAPVESQKPLLSSTESGNVHFGAIGGTQSRLNEQRKSFGSFSNCPYKLKELKVEVANTSCFINESGRAELAAAFCATTVARSHEQRKAFNQTLSGSAHSYKPSAIYSNEHGSAITTTTLAATSTGILPSKVVERRKSSLTLNTSYSASKLKETKQSVLMDMPNLFECPTNQFTSGTAKPSKIKERRTSNGRVLTTVAPHSVSKSRESTVDTSKTSKFSSNGNYISRTESITTLAGGASCKNEVLRNGGLVTTTLAGGASYKNELLRNGGLVASLKTPISRAKEMKSPPTTEPSIKYGFSYNELNKSTSLGGAPSKIHNRRMSSCTILINESPQSTRVKELKTPPILEPSKIHDRRKSCNVSSVNSPPQLSRIKDNKTPVSLNKGNSTAKRTSATILIESLPAPYRHKNSPKFKCVKPPSETPHSKERRLTVSADCLGCPEKTDRRRVAEHISNARNNSADLKVVKEKLQFKLGEPLSSDPAIVISVLDNSKLANKYKSSENHPFDESSTNDKTSNKKMPAKIDRRRKTFNEYLVNSAAKIAIPKKPREKKSYSNQSNNKDHIDSVKKGSTKQTKKSTHLEAETKKQEAISVSIKRTNETKVPSDIGRISKRRKTLPDVVLGIEEVETSNQDAITSVPHKKAPAKVQRRRKTLAYEKVDEEPTSKITLRPRKNRSKSVDLSDYYTKRITRLTSHEFGIDCTNFPELENLRTKDRPRSKSSTYNTKSKKSKKNEVSSDSDTDVSNVSYRSSSSYENRSKSRELSRNKYLPPKLIPIIPIGSNLQDPRLKKYQTESNTTSGIATFDTPTNCMVVINGFIEPSPGTHNTHQPPINHLNSNEDESNNNALIRQYPNCTWSLQSPTDQMSDNKNIPWSLKMLDISPSRKEVEAKCEEVKFETAVKLEPLNSDALKENAKCTEIMHLSVKVCNISACSDSTTVRQPTNTTNIIDLCDDDDEEDESLVLISSINNLLKDVLKTDEVETTNTIIDKNTARLSEEVQSHDQNIDLGEKETSSCSPIGTQSSITQESELSFTHHPEPKLNSGQSENSETEKSNERKVEGRKANPLCNIKGTPLRKSTQSPNSTISQTNTQTNYSQPVSETTSSTPANQSAISQNNTQSNYSQSVSETTISTAANQSAISQTNTQTNYSQSLSETTISTPANQVSANCVVPCIYITTYHQFFNAFCYSMLFYIKLNEMFSAQMNYYQEIRIPNEHLEKEWNQLRIVLDNKLDVFTSDLLKYFSNKIIAQFDSKMLFTYCFKRYSNAGVIFQFPVMVKFVFLAVTKIKRSHMNLNGFMKEFCDSVEREFLQSRLQQSIQMQQLQVGSNENNAQNVHTVVQPTGQNVENTQVVQTRMVYPQRIPPPPYHPPTSMTNTQNGPPQQISMLAIKQTMQIFNQIQFYYTLVKRYYLLTNAGVCPESINKQLINANELLLLSKQKFKQRIVDSRTVPSLPVSVPQVTELRHSQQKQSLPQLSPLISPPNQILSNVNQRVDPVLHALRKLTSSNSIVQNINNCPLQNNKYLRSMLESNISTPSTSSVATNQSLIVNQRYNSSNQLAPNVSKSSTSGINNFKIHLPLSKPRTDNSTSSSKSSNTPITPPQETSVPNHQFASNIPITAQPEPPVPNQQFSSNNIRIAAQSEPPVPNQQFSSSNTPITAQPEPPVSVQQFPSTIKLNTAVDMPETNIETQKDIAKTEISLIESEPLQSDEIIDVEKYFLEKMNSGDCYIDDCCFNDIKLEDTTTESQTEAQMEDEQFSNNKETKSAIPQHQSVIEHLEVLDRQRYCICSNKAELVCPCGKAIYCSTNCQTKDWINHQNMCISAREEKTPK